jgi:hypothetical protein
MYQIKLYNKSKAFKKVINLNIIKNNITFTKQINGGLWQFSLLLDLKFDWNLDYKSQSWTIYSFIKWDIIEITSFNEWYERLIYSWYIEEIINNIWNFQEVELRINWLASLFKRLIYNVWWNYTANINQDTFSTIEYIKDFINNYYNYFTEDYLIIL